MKYLIIGAFGLIGVFARYGINLFVGPISSSEFPWATFYINMAGSFFIGIVYVLAVEKAIVSQDVRTGLMVGLLGGFTTFSAFSLESMVLLKGQNYALAFTYLMSSSVLGVALAFGGAFLTRSFWI